MRAVEYDRPGPSSVLTVREVPAPNPGPDEVVVEVHAAALNPKDVLLRSGKFGPMGGRFPRRAGYDWAGEAVAVGGNVRSVRPGDRLYGMIQAWSAGAFAERAAVLASECAPLPERLSYREAAALPLTALTAWQALRDVARLGPGQRALLHGASGGVGVAAIQLARVLGAHVTTLSSAANLDLCRSLGAHEALDHASASLDRSAPFDVFFDIFGNRSFAEARPVLTPRGRYVTTVPSARNLRDVATTVLSRQRAHLVVVRSKRSDLIDLARLATEGLLRPVIDSEFALADIAAAYDRVGTKHARGKVVVVVR